jgi:hypothetical protein
MPELATLVRQTGARLVIVDVMTAFLPKGTDSHKDQDIRRVLTPLARMAGELQCTVLMLRHLKKSEASSAILAGLGAVGISGAARAAMLAAEYEDGYVLTTSKSNLGKRAPSLRYQISDSGIEWGGECDVAADDLVVTEENPARAWLRKQLADGPALSQIIKERGKEVGFSERALQRAAKDIGVVSKREDFQSGTHWSLRGGTTGTGGATGANGATGDPAASNAMTGVDAAGGDEETDETSEGGWPSRASRDSYDSSAVARRNGDNIPKPCIECGGPVYAGNGVIGDFDAIHDYCFYNKGTHVDDDEERMVS